MELQSLHPLFSYLKLRRTRAILGSYLAISLLIVAVPGIDLGTARLFFDGGFYMANQGWTKLLHASVIWFIYVSLATVGLICPVNRLKGRSVWGIDGREFAYLLLDLALGPVGIDVVYRAARRAPVIGAALLSPGCAQPQIPSVSALIGNGAEPGSI